MIMCEVLQAAGGIVLLVLHRAGACCLLVSPRCRCCVVSTLSYPWVWQVCAPVLCSCCVMPAKQQ
jgi:hypothetical protein